MREISVRELHKVGMFTRNGLAAAVALSAAALTSTATAQGFALYGTKRAQSLQDVRIAVAEIKDCYYSVQIVDAYLSSSAYLGTRAL